MSKQIRLNKYLAERLGISRREADDLIASGRILINQKVAKLGDRVNLPSSEDEESVADSPENADFVKKNPLPGGNSGQNLPKDTKNSQNSAVFFEKDKEALVRRRSASEEKDSIFSSEPTPGDKVFRQNQECDSTPVDNASKSDDSYRIFKKNLETPRIASEDALAQSFERHRRQYRDMRNEKLTPVEPAFSRESSKNSTKSIDNFDEVCYNGDIGALANMRRAHAFQVQKNGRIIISPEVERIYLALNKPVGYVCSRKRQGENPTIYELLPKKFQELKTVGRLDKDSSGLILLTNDGDFAFQMTHPRFAKVKIYEVELDHALEPLHQQMIVDFGIELGDGVSKLGLERLDEDRKRWRVTMSEGRNRQIRRTFGALGYTVTALHRTDFGPYRLNGLKNGEFVKI